MNPFLARKRTIVGQNQLPPGHGLVEVEAYAARFYVSPRTVRRWCRLKKVRAYKNAGRWLIVVPREAR